VRWPRRRLIGVVRRLDIEPGDRFVITFPRRITAEEARHVAEVISVRLQLDAEVNPVGILDDGATAVVIRDKRLELERWARAEVERTAPPACGRPSCYDGPDTTASRIEHGCIPDWRRP